MRIYYLALAIFCFNIAMQLVAASGLYPYYSVEASAGWNESVMKYKNASYATAGISQETLSFGFGDFVRALTLFVDLIWNSVTGAGKLLTMFGFPDDIADYVNALVLFVYAAGVIQFISGRAFKQNA